MTNYTQTSLLAAIYDSKIEANAASQIDQQGVANFAVRQVLMDLDLRSAKRLAPAVDVFDDVYDVSCPTDLKSIKIIDLVPQVNRSSNFEVNLVSAEEFDRRKSFEKGLVAFNDHDGLRKLRIAVTVDSKKITAISLDTLTSGGGTWIASGDAQNLRVDTQNYVEGVGSLLWDIGAGATGVAGIKNTALNAFDITSYLLQGSVFAWYTSKRPRISRALPFISAAVPPITTRSPSRRRMRGTHSRQDGICSVLTSARPRRADPFLPRPRSSISTQTAAPR